VLTVYPAVAGPRADAPTSIRINLILPESRVIGYIFVAGSIVYLHSNCRGGLRKTHVF